MAPRILKARTIPADAPEVNQARVIVAASKRVDTSNKREIRALGKNRQGWQADAWLVFHSMGVVKYADRFLANTCARLRWYAAVAGDDGNPPIAVSDPDSGIDATTARAAEDVVARLALANGGHGGLMKSLVLNLEVAGECWMLGYPDRDPVTDAEGATVRPRQDEHWEVRSVLEVFPQGDTMKIKRYPEAQAEVIPDDVMLVRMWEPDPSWHELPDSALRSVLADADEFLIMARQIRALARSKMTAGLFTVPSELSFGPADPTQSEAEDPLSQMLMDLFIDPIADESHPSAVVPGLLRGKAEYLDQKFLRHITFNREVDRLFVDLRKECQDRVVDGLNLPREVVNGMSDLSGLGGGNVAAMIDASTFSAHVEPRAIGIFDAITGDVFRPMLRDYPGVSLDQVDRMFVWYDESEVVTQPDRSTAAGEAHDRNTISDDAYRKAVGFSDADAPDPEELARRTGLKRGILDGPITETLMAYLLGQTFVRDVEAIRESNAAIEATATDTSGDSGDGADVPEVSDTGTEAVAAAVVRRLARLDVDLLRSHPEMRAVVAANQRQNPGERLAALDRDLFVRLRIAADAAMTRALERAGARLRSIVAGGSRHAAARTAVQNVENRLVAATLGPAVVAALDPGDLFAGAFDGLHAQWDTWVGDVQASALDITQTVFGVGDDRRPTIEARMREDRDHAWSWFHAALLDLARGLLTEPVTAAQTRTTAGLIGEADPSLSIPAATVREAMTRAGGAQGLEVRQTQAGGVVLTTDAGIRPAGGVATGQTVLGLAADEGFPVAWYVWAHGAPARPFEPHAALDGVTFYAEDDPNLASADAWIGAYYSPGDHKGCTCWASPWIGDRTTADTIG